MSKSTGCGCDKPTRHIQKYQKGDGVILPNPLNHRKVGKYMRSFGGPDAAASALVVGDKNLTRFNGPGEQGSVVRTSGNTGQVFQNSGDQRGSFYGLKNNVVAQQVDLRKNMPTGTTNRLVKSNYLGSRGFRGRGWKQGMDKEGKAEFRKEHKFYNPNRSRLVQYDFSKGKKDNVSAGLYTTYTDKNGFITK
jgi:hypothetical protein